MVNHSGGVLNPPVFLQKKVPSSLVSILESQSGCCQIASKAVSIIRLASLFFYRLFSRRDKAHVEGSLFSVVLLKDLITGE